LLAFTKPCKNLVSLQQFTAIRLCNAMLQFSDQLLTSQSTHVVIAFDPCGKRETVPRRELCRFGFEFFNRHTGTVAPDAHTGQDPTANPCRRILILLASGYRQLAGMPGG
jgi:hypothetical protein